MTARRQIVAAGLMIVLISGGSPVLAQQESPQQVEAARAACLGGFPMRFEWVGWLRTIVDSSEDVRDHVRSRLHQKLDESNATLADIRGRIQTAQTVSGIRDHCFEMLDQRVYMRLGPQVKLILTAEKAWDVARALGEISERLQGSIAAAAAAGASVELIQADADTFKAKAFSAGATAGRITDSLMGLGPEGWPSNRSVLRSSREELGELPTLLREARDAGEVAVRALLAR